MQFNKQQEEVINTKKGNISVIATAGSGKTTVLAHRIKNIVIDYDVNPSHILAVTFSRKAKENIMQKLLELQIYNVNVETFHSIALKIIQSTYGSNYYKIWTAYWEKEKLIQDICMHMIGCSRDSVPVNDIFSFIVLQKVNMLYPEDKLIYPSIIPHPYDEENRMGKIYELYEKTKKKNLCIEFDDFLNIVNKIFETQPDVLKKYQDLFQYVLVDEFQDISFSQALFLRYINNTNTMIVGDPLQAIYSFRGGKSKYILNFDIDYDDVKVVNLNTNYRCSEDIVNIANKLASFIPDSSHKLYVESIASKPNYKIPELRHFDTDFSEGIWIANKISQLVKEEDNYSNIAILARTNAQLQKLEGIFHDTNIPFDVVDGILFTDQPEIKLILSYLKLALDENDDEAFQYLYNKPNRWLSKKFLEETKNNSNDKNISLYKSMDTIGRRNWRFKNGINEIYEVIHYIQTCDQNVSDIIHYIRKRLNIDSFITKGGPFAEGKYIEQIENLDSFEDMCKDYKDIKTLFHFINNLNKNKEVNNDTVKLLTIHKSKGMEFPIVFIIGCNDTLLPHMKSCDINDERRLLYVAITRAEKELYMSYVDLYNNNFVNVSPFVKDIKDTIREVKENILIAPGDRNGLRF